MFNPVSPYQYLLPTMYLFMKNNCLCLVVGPGFVLTSPYFLRSITSHPAGPHGRLGQKTVNRKASTQFARQFVTAVTNPLLGAKDCIHHYHPRPHFYDIHRWGRSFTTCPGQNLFIHKVYRTTSTEKNNENLTAHQRIF